MANGKIIYPSGDPSALTYAFALNPSEVKGPTYLDTRDRQRSFDGTLNSFSGASKRSWELTFDSVKMAQLEQFQNLYNFGCDLDLYLDGDNVDPDGTVQIMEPPEPDHEPKWLDGERVYSFSVRFEET